MVNNGKKKKTELMNHGKKDIYGESCKKKTDLGIMEKKETWCINKYFQCGQYPLLWLAP